MNDFIIIGGGLIGLLTARFLRLSGANVHILEQGKLGQESSWAGGGIISPLYPWRYPHEVSLLSRYSQQHYKDLCKTLFEETGIDPEWTPSGLLIPSLKELEQAQSWATKHNSNIEILRTQKELNEIEPTINPSLTEGIWMPDVAQLRNPRILKSLIASVKHHDIQITENCQVTAFQYDKGKVAGVTTNQGEFNADNIVVTTGAWSSFFPEFSTQSVNVKPVLGQMVLFKTHPKKISRIILHNGRYIIPRRDGRVVCGSTLEHKGFDKVTTEHAKEELQAAAIRLAPCLADYPIEHHWAGLRPGSPNGVPYIGEHPEIKNLYINTGHYRNGVVMGLGSTQLLLDIIQQKNSFVDPDLYQLNAQRIPTAEFQHA